MAFTFPAQLPPLKTQTLSTKELVRSASHFITQEMGLDFNNQHLLLAVSGGADSLALLCFWQWFSKIQNCSFSLLHINHGLRPESLQESQSIAELCKAWHIPYFIEERDVPRLAHENNTGFEEMARTIRYELYEIYRKKCDASWVCLGHHLQDVQEDVIMRLIRGSGWPALGGMVAQDAQRHILRPLLMQEPQALRTLLQSAGLSWAEDASNADVRFMRNRVRHTILPLLQAENPSFSKKTQELWHFAQYDADYWQLKLDNLCTTHNIRCENKTIILPAQLLKKIDKATRLRLYLLALSKLMQAAPQLAGQAGAHTLFALDAALLEGRGNTIFQLPGSIHAYLKKGAVTFSYE